MIVPYLALVLFAPWFAILGWAYWNYPRVHIAGGLTRRFDVATLLVALIATTIAMRWTFFMPFKGTGSLWPQVIATLAAYHAFLAVLVVAWFVRPRIHRP